MSIASPFRTPLFFMICLCGLFSITPSIAQEANNDFDMWEEISFDLDKPLRLTEEQIEMLIGYLSSTAPDRAKELESLRQNNPKEFIKAVHDEYIKFAQQLKKDMEPPSKDQPPQTDPWKEHLQKSHEAFLEWMQQNYPQEAQELIKIKDSNPEKYVQHTGELMKVYEPIQRAERYNPPLAEVMKEDLRLQRKRDQVLSEYRNAKEPADRERLKKEIETLVSTRFDLTTKKKQLEYDALRKRLERLQQRLESQAAELEKLKDIKDKAVQERMKDLLERTETMSWN